MSQNEAAASGRPAPGTEILSDQSPSLGPLLAEIGGTLLISTYQAGKVVVARHEGGIVHTDFLDARRPMGIAVAPGQLAIGAQGEIQFFQDVKSNCAKLEPAGKFDACYQPRYAHLTGQIDIHEMAFGGDGQIFFINTRFSALCTLHGSTSFAPVWRPPFISAYAPEDRCHLNGLGLRDGRPRYVTALGESDQPAGWRERKADGGVLIDLVGNRTICRGLSMPHSPRWHAERLWICESGKGLLSTVDPASGQMTTVAEFPGFTRGLDFAGPYAFVGLSQIRESASFSGIPIVERAAERNCGIWVVDTRTGKHVGALRFTQGVQEIFSAQLLHGTSCPALLDKYHKVALESYFLPTETLRDVRASASPQATKA
jgi:uncharacterized protein (TIGR03032 family)